MSFRSYMSICSLILLLTIVVAPAHAQSHAHASALFKQPDDLALDARGNLWVVDSARARVTELSPAGKVLTSWGSNGAGRGRLSSPDGIAVGPNGDVWISAGGDNPAIDEFSPSGKFLAARSDAGKISGLGGRMALDAKGDLWIALGGGVDDIPDVVELSPSGKEIIQWQAPHKKTTTRDGIAVDPRGYVYLSSEYTNLIYKFTTKGKFLGYVAKHGQKLGQVDTPEGLALDTHGDLYIAEQGNSRVQELSPSGKPVRAFGDFFSVQEPQAVAVNSKGHVYMLDNTGIHVYTSHGKQTAYWH